MKDLLLQYNQAIASLQKDVSNVSDCLESVVFEKGPNGVSSRSGNSFVSLEDSIVTLFDSVKLLKELHKDITKV